MPITRGAKAESPRAHILHKVRELPCPACDTGVLVARRDLVEGGEVACAACGAPLALTREWDEATERHHWTLVDAQGEFDDPHEHP